MRKILTKTNSKRSAFEFFKNDSNFNLNLLETKIDIFNCEFLGNCKQVTLNNTEIKINFIKANKAILEKYIGRFISSFSQIIINIVRHPSGFA